MPHGPGSWVPTEGIHPPVSWAHHPGHYTLEREDKREESMEVWTWRVYYVKEVGGKKGKREGQGVKKVSKKENGQEGRQKNNEQECMWTHTHTHTHHTHTHYVTTSILLFIYSCELTWVKPWVNLSSCCVGSLIGKTEIGGKLVKRLIQFNLSRVLLLVGLPWCSHNGSAVACPVIKCSKHLQNKNLT